MSAPFFELKFQFLEMYLTQGIQSSYPLIWCIFLWYQSVKKIELTLTSEKWTIVFCCGQDKNVADMTKISHLGSFSLTYVLFFINFLNWHDKSHHYNDIFHIQTKESILVTKEIDITGGWYLVRNIFLNYSFNFLKYIWPKESKLIILLFDVYSYDINQWKRLN